MSDGITDAYGPIDRSPDYVFCHVCKDVRLGSFSPCNSCRRKIERFIGSNKKITKLRKDYKKTEKKLKELEKAETKLHDKLFKQGEKLFKKKSQRR